METQNKLRELCSKLGEIRISLKALEQEISDELREEYKDAERLLGDASASMNLLEILMN